MLFSDRAEKLGWSRVCSWTNDHGPGFDEFSGLEFPEFWDLWQAPSGRFAWVYNDLYAQKETPKLNSDWDNDDLYEAERKTLRQFTTQYKWRK